MMWSLLLQVVLNVALLSDDGCYELGPALQRMPSLERLELGGDEHLDMYRKSGTGGTWSAVRCFSLDLPCAVQLLASLAAHPPTVSAPGSSLGQVTLVANPPPSPGEAARWLNAAQGLGPALEAGGCEGLGLWVEVGEGEAGLSLAEALLCPRVAARLTGLDLRCEAAAPRAATALLGHLASRPLPELCGLSWSWGEAQAECWAQALGSLAHVTAPRLRHVSTSCSRPRPDTEQHALQLIELCRVCAARPQPVDAAGNPVQLVLGGVPRDTQQRVRAFLQTAGLEARVALSEY